jgi:hypothetical protein
MPFLLEGLLAEHGEVCIVIGHHYTVLVEFVSKVQDVQLNLHYVELLVAWGVHYFSYKFLVDLFLPLLECKLKKLLYFCRAQIALD